MHKRTNKQPDCREDATIEALGIIELMCDLVHEVSKARVYIFIRSGLPSPYQICAGSMPAVCYTLMV